MQDTTHASSNSKKSNMPIIIIGSLFFIFGFVTWLNSVLIPYLRIACQLSNAQSYLVTFAFYISYLVMALPSARVLNKTGFKKGMIIGLIVMAIGAAIFIPAALTRVYFLFLLGIFIMGTGLALLQTASNPYIAILGPAESAAKRISIMGICNKVAGALAPIALGAVTLKNADILTTSLRRMSLEEKTATLQELADRVILPYCLIVGVLLILASLIKFSPLPELENDEEETGISNLSQKTSVFQFPNLVLGAITMFLYVGVEVMAGDTIISYASHQGISLSAAKFFTSFTLGSMLIGYILGIICIPRYVSQQNALKYSAVLGIMFSLAALLFPSYWSVLFIALLGLANSLMWPAIWPLAIAGLGKFTKIGSSLLIMAISGGAVLPLLYGLLTEEFGAQQSYIILLPSYAFILYYSLSGYKKGNSLLK